MAHVLEQVKPEEELGLVAYREQFLLYLDRPIVNFGHRRSFEGAQEYYDAAAWLNGSGSRVLLVPEAAVRECFPTARKSEESSRTAWYLVRGAASSDCAARGDAARASKLPVRLVRPMPVGGGK